MKQYIYSLIPRLKQYSQTLDKKELFIDQPWVYIDKNENHQKYIFQRTGELIMSLNGQVTLGKWEYVAPAKSLLIDRIVDKILLNQAFIDPAIMVLKMDGPHDEYLFLANENLIPDLNVFAYLQNIYHISNKIRGVKLKDGQVLEVHDYDGSINNNKVTIEANPVPDGVFESAASDRKFVVNDGRITNMYKLETFETNRGVITIEKDLLKSDRISKGNLAFQDGKPAPDGKYRIDFLYSITVKDGKVTRS